MISWHKWALSLFSSLWLNVEYFQFMCFAQQKQGKHHFYSCVSKKNLSQN